MTHQIVWLWRVGLAILVGVGVAVLLACTSSAERPLITTNFPDEVIVAAQYSVIGVSPLMPRQTRGRVAGLPKRSISDRPEPSFTFEPTRASVLAGLRELCSPSRMGRNEIPARLRADAQTYMVPLLEVIEDAAVEIPVRRRAANLLMTHIRIPKGWPDVEQATLRNRIFDAVMPVAQVAGTDYRGMARGLLKFTTRDRLETLVTLIETATSDQREALISLFGSVTHTAWPHVGRMFCGNSSPHSIQQSITSNQAKQAAAVPEIRAWWEANKHKSDLAWELDGLKALLADHRNGIKKSAASGNDQYLEWSIRGEPRNDRRRLTAAVLPALEQHFETSEPRMKPGILQLLVRIGGYGKYAALVQEQLNSGDEHMRHVVEKLIRDAEFDQRQKADVQKRAAAKARQALASKDSPDEIQGKLSQLRSQSNGGAARSPISDPTVGRLPELIEDYRRGRNRSRFMPSNMLPPVRLGIPGLSPAIAAELLGRDGAVDMWLVEYCYNKYGQEALPLVREFMRTWAAKGMYFWAAPFWEILREHEGDMETWERLVITRLANPNPKARDWIPLLGTFSDRRSERLIGRLLNSKEAWQVEMTAEAVGLRGLVQHADRLAEIDASTAVVALAQLGDPRALDRLGPVITTTRSDHRTGTPDERFAHFVGRQLAPLKRQHRAALHAQVRHVLANPPTGDPIAWNKTLLTLTVAVAYQPAADDLHFLHELAASDGPLEVRTLAAIALAHADQRQVLPVLHELAFEHMRQPGHYSSSGRQWPFTEEQMERLPGINPVFRKRHRTQEDQMWHDALPLEMKDLGLALRVLGDGKLLQPVLAALKAESGDVNYTALRLLAGIAGKRTTYLLAERFDEFDPTLRQWLLRGCLQLFEYGLDADHLATCLEPEALVEAANLFPPGTRFPDALNDQLVAAYRHGRMSARGLAVLCRIGDQRGLDLAVDDPLLLATLSWSIADCPPAAFVRYGLVLNRTEDALAFRAWYRQHRDQLVWHPEIGKWRLADQGK